MMGRIDPKCRRTRGTGTGDVHRRRVTFGGCQVTVPGGGVGRWLEGSLWSQARPNTNNQFRP